MVINKVSSYHIFFISEFQLSQITISVLHVSIGSLSSDVIERRTATGSERFSLFICPTKFVLPSVVTLIKTICCGIFSKSQPKSLKSPLPVDVRRSKTSLLKLPYTAFVTLETRKKLGRVNFGKDFWDCYQMTQRQRERLKRQ